MDINDAFQITFKLIFGECNVTLDELTNYLSRWHYPPVKKKSSISGKDVLLSSWLYRDGAKFISQDEIDFDKKYGPIDVNKIKDIDSITEAIRDRIGYAGNKIFGNSSHIDESDNCTDCNYVSKSHNIFSAKYVSNSIYLRHGSEYAFGASFSPGCKYVINVSYADNLTRCFETYMSANNSDLFFCYSCNGCMHTMFSFNQRSKRYCIGNNELPKDKYMELRKKLLDESREYIEKNKEFYSMFRTAPLDEKTMESLALMHPEKIEEAGDLKPINSAFESASKSIFGESIGLPEEYEKYLCERIKKVRTAKTVLGKEVYYNPVYFFEEIPKDRIANRKEAEEAAKLRIAIEDSDGLAKIMEKMGSIAIFPVNAWDGDNKNIMKSAVIDHGTGAYYIGDLMFGKNCAYCTLAVDTEAVFGSFRASYSKFCIRCESSVNLTACFECDSCTNCANSMFCHNCENMDNCMFCFNTKSKRYAIGNVEVGRDEYMRVKKIVIDKLVEKLKIDKRLKIDIYNLERK
ncbi:MAG: hypothetical protein WCT31_03600 [Candidatus Micrarchaeia archaeon]|jgi:hypothetical protein